MLMWVYSGSQILTGRVIVDLKPILFCAGIADRSQNKAMWLRLCSLSCIVILLELMSFWGLSTSPWPILMCMSDLETGEWHVYIIKVLIYDQDVFTDCG